MEEANSRSDGAVKETKSFSFPSLPGDDITAPTTTTTTATSNRSEPTWRKRSPQVKYANAERGKLGRRQDFDEGVIAVALHNYDLFYNLNKGTVTFEIVQATSAGIQGWAASVLANDAPKTGQQAIRATVDTIAELSRIDEEEELELQIALMESFGAHPRRFRDIQTVSDCDANDDDDH
jgi:hypothetical protein